MNQTTPSIITAARELSEAANKLTFKSPITHVYNPLDYAWEMHKLYLSRYANGQKRIIFMGMNPGPFGMGQTGIPFGEIAAVRDWMKLSAPISSPATENPKKPVQGLKCPRTEISGQRLWGYFATTFGPAENFFKDHFVLNYCPLAFLSDTKNITPDKLPASEAVPLTALCDQHLQKVITAIKPEWVVGVGKYARKQAERALKQNFPTLKFADILHPSPASPIANRGWAEQAEKQLIAQGIWTAAGQLPD